MVLGTVIQTKKFEVMAVQNNVYLTLGNLPTENLQHPCLHFTNKPDVQRKSPLSKRLRTHT